VLRPKAPSSIAWATAASICRSSSGVAGRSLSPQHQVADAARADEGAEVDGRRRPLERLPVARQRREVRRDAVALEDLAVLRQDAGVDRGDRAAFPGDLGGDALRDLAGGARVDEHVVLGLPEHVDEAGRDDQLAGVDAPLGLGALEAPTAATRSPATQTSARNHGAPVPSTTRPPAKSRSHETGGAAGERVAPRRASETSATGVYLMARLDLREGGEFYRKKGWHCRPSRG
jgi:hypothetical protein